MRALATLLLAVGLVMPCTAATTAGSFNVNIRLNDSETGRCVSASQSILTNALVTVTCKGNQFVSITPRAGQPFLGTHGGAYRFTFSGALPIGLAGGQALLGDSLGNGTITSLRILNLTEADARFELLVSF